MVALAYVGEQGIIGIWCCVMIYMFSNQLYKDKNRKLGQIQKMFHITGFVGLIFIFARLVDYRSVWGIYPHGIVEILANFAGVILYGDISYFVYVSLVTTSSVVNMGTAQVPIFLKASLTFITTVAAVSMSGCTIWAYSVDRQFPLFIAKVSQLFSIASSLFFINYGSHLLQKQMKDRVQKPTTSSLIAQSVSRPSAAFNSSSNLSNGAAPDGKVRKFIKRASFSIKSTLSAPKKHVDQVGDAMKRYKRIINLGNIMFILVLGVLGFNAKQLWQDGKQKTLRAAAPQPNKYTIDFIPFVQVIAYSAKLWFSWVRNSVALKKNFDKIGDSNISINSDINSATSKSNGGKMRRASMMVQSVNAFAKKTDNIKADNIKFTIADDGKKKKMMHARSASSDTSKSSKPLVWNKEAARASIEAIKLVESSSNNNKTDNTMNDGNTATKTGSLQSAINGDKFTLSTPPSKKNPNTIEVIIDGQSSKDKNANANSFDPKDDEATRLLKSLGVWKPVAMSGANDVVKPVVKSSPNDKMLTDKSQNGIANAKARVWNKDAARASIAANAAANASTKIDTNSDTKIDTKTDTKTDTKAESVEILVRPPPGSPMKLSTNSKTNGTGKIEEVEISDGDDLSSDDYQSETDYLLENTKVTVMDITL